MSFFARYVTDLVSWHWSVCFCFRLLFVVRDAVIMCTIWCFAVQGVWRILWSI